MSDKILDVWQWHSCDPLDELLAGKAPQLRKRVVMRAAATAGNLKRFIIAGKGNLIHRASHAWWAFSEDGTHIEAVDQTQALDEGDLEAGSYEE